MFPNVIIQDLDEFSEMSVNSNMKKMEKDINSNICFDKNECEQVIKPTTKVRPNATL